MSEYGPERVRTVLERALKASAANPAGFIVRALEQGWQFADISRKPQGIAPSDPMAYVSGKYAAYINH